MKRKRLKRRGGCWLQLGVTAAEYVAADERLAKLDATLAEDGYRLSPAVRVYWSLARDTVTIRIVWRKRETGRSSTWTEIEQWPMAAIREAAGRVGGADAP